MSAALDPVPRFRFNGLEPTLREVAEACARTRVSRALVLIEEDVPFERPRLEGAIRELAASGCVPGFRLAWVARSNRTYESLVRAEPSGLREGISIRVFFDVRNAERWLAL